MESLVGKFRKLFGRGAFARNVASIATGTAVGQGLVILASPLLTRLYAPEDFGLLSVYASVLGIMVVVASLRYQLAIPLPKSDTTAANLLALSLLIVIGFAVVTFVVSFPFRDQFSIFLNAPHFASYMWFVPLGIASAGLYQALSYWAIRKKQYGILARTKLTQGIGTVITQLGVGYATGATWGLLAGDVIGRAGGGTNIFRLAWRESREAFRHVSMMGIRAVAQRYRAFAFVSTFSGLANSLGLYLPALLLARYYGVEVAGLYALGQLIVGAPITVVGQAVLQVYLGEAASVDRQHLHTMYMRAAKRLLAVGVAPCVIVALTGEWAFEHIFGSAWARAGLYAQILAPMYLSQFVASPLSPTLNVIERQDIQLAWDVGRMVLVGGGLVAAVYLGAADAAVIAVLSTTAAVAYGVLVVATRSALLVRPTV